MHLQTEKYLRIMHNDGWEVKLLEIEIDPNDPAVTFLATPTNDGKWKFVSRMNPDLSFGILPGQTGSGNPVVVGPNVNAWTVHPKGGDIFVLQAENSEACMNLRNGRQYDTDICIWGGDWTEAGDNDMWEFLPCR